MSTHKHTHTISNTISHAYMYCVYTYVGTPPETYTHVYTHTHIYIPIPLNTHTYTHAYCVCTHPQHPPCTRTQLQMEEEARKHHYMLSTQCVSNGFIVYVHSFITHPPPKRYCTIHNTVQGRPPSTHYPPLTHSTSSCV